jgi:hypothetical protein
VLTISQVIYTRQVNQTFDSPSTEIDSALTQTRDQMITSINNVCALVFAQLERTKLLTVEALLTLQVHWRDIFEMLIKHHVKSRDWILMIVVVFFVYNRFGIKMILNGKKIFDMIGVRKKRIFKFCKLMRVFCMVMNILDVQVDWLLHH